MRSLGLFLAILLGLFFQEGHRYTFLIKYIVIAISFLSFVNVKIDRNLFFKPHVFLITLTAIALSFFLFALINVYNSDLALVAFMLAISPTAMAAPVITTFLNGRVDYVISSTLVTNVVVALLLPLLLPAIAQQNLEISAWKILTTNLNIIAIPLVLSQLVIILPDFEKALIKVKTLSFYGWLLAIYLATAKANYFITRENDIPTYIIGAIALISLVVCLLNFSIGRFLGGQTLTQESSQALGQKNTMFTIWISINFLNPLVTLGAMFYIIYQNLYNSYLLLNNAKKTS
jgi:bile acid:Na+ symporter, BASS family